MARKTPTVRDNTLAWHDGDDHSLAVGSGAWYAWLEQASTFFYVGRLGTFTACKEQPRRGGPYWRAHRSFKAKLHHAYLGKSATLTAERLDEVCATLAAKITSVAERPAGKELVAPGGPMPDTGRVEDARGLRRALFHDVDEPLLASKLLPPAVRADFVPRPRLVEWLEEVWQYRLALISAPAGSGKTTLLGQWSQQSQRPVASVSLDAEDDDPARFWTYLVAALQRLSPAFAEAALPLLRSPQRASFESGLKALINALGALPDDLAIVLDDFHTIRDPAIHHAVNYLLDHLPPTVHLIIATRADPPLALGRLRGTGQMIELRASDLSFSLEEAEIFLNHLMKLSLAREDVAALEERTEGWAVGLQVAGLSLRGRSDARAFIDSFAGDHRHIIDFLVEEVLVGLPSETRSFLLQTSILDRLNAGLCEAITGRGNAQAMLETLERTNLFTLPLQAGAHWYRYHHLFSDFLRGRLQQTQRQRVPELHRRASAWYAANDLPRDAVNHALAARDLDLAAGLMEQLGFALLTRGEMATLLSWVQALPDEIVRARPRLCIMHAWALATLFQLEAAESRLRDADQLLASASATSPSAGPVNPAETEIQADQIATIRTLIANARGDWQRVIDFGTRVLHRHPDLDVGIETSVLQYLGDAYWRSGDLARAVETLTEASRSSEAAGHIPNQTISLVELGSVYAIQGRLADAASSYQRALKLVAAPETRGSWYAGLPHLGIARLHYEWNELAAALLQVTIGIDLAHQGGPTPLLLAGYVTLARLKQAEGDLPGARQTIEEARDLAMRTDSRREIQSLKCYQARLWLQEGNVDRAATWARESGLLPDDEPRYERETEYLMLAQVLAAEGEAGRARSLLDRLQGRAEAAGRTGSLIKVLLLQGLVLGGQAGADDGLPPVARATGLAEPEGYVRTFVDRGASARRLLSRLLEPACHRRFSATSVGSPAYLRKLLRAFDPGAPRPAEEVGSSAGPLPAAGPLGARELEILRLIARGSSNREIAHALVVSLNTVKTHRQNIYGKLDAHDGKEAVAKARDRHLL